MENSVITNLSDTALTKNQIAVLNKGLNYIPYTKHFSYTQLDQDMLRFERKLQLFHFFRDKEEESDDEIDNTRLAFEENPNYWPHKLNKDITELCRELKQEIYMLYKQKNKFQNLTKYEKIALKQLKQNKELIIKKADKNSGIVIMNRCTYEEKIYQMLRDEKVYKSLSEDDSLIVKSKVDSLLKKLLHDNCLTEKQYLNLTNYKIKTPIFYGIPKIHKLGNPLRPIVSQINGPCYRMNQLIHEILLVAESEIPYLFKDTTAFLQVIEDHKNVTNDTFLVTMDVVSLYTNIPQDEAIEFICEHYENTLHCWHNYKTKVLPVKTIYLKQLLQLMLSNCTFEFNNEYYSQLYGTPMGAPASVRIANIYMYKLLHKFQNNYNGYKPSFIGRLIDDLFFLWHKEEAELLKFYEKLNNFHTTIKFELTYSKEKVNFLDTTVYISENILKTTLYIKPTDKKQYLSYYSSHPKHIMKAIPYSQALRYRRIITDDEILCKELDKLLHKFTNRGYPILETKSQIYKVLNIRRTDSLKYKTITQKQEEFRNFTKGGSFLPLILTYRPEYVRTEQNLYTVLNTLWNTYVNNYEVFKTTFGNSTPKIVFKKGQNLSNILIRAKYSNNTIANTSTENLIQCLAELASENNIKYRVDKCNSIRCKLCTHIQTDSSFHSSTTQQTFAITENMNCGSIDTIYLITCIKCKKQYVGESHRPLRERFNNHRSDIKLQKNTAIGKHFNEIMHEPKDFKVTPIETISDTIHRKDKESSWIKILNTRYPHGLNYYPL